MLGRWSWLAPSATRGTVCVEKVVGAVELHFGADRQWGRWLLDGGYLVYLHDPGQLAPEYEIDLSRVKDQEDVERLVDHMASKKWVRPDDLTTLREACATALKARLAEERVRFAEACASLADERSLPVPQAMGWDEYGKILKDLWQRFLVEADSSDEAAFHRFLEHHPGLVPGPYGTPRFRWHGPLRGIVFTHPELPGIRSKRPDFLVLEQDSGNVYAVLVEIEAPGKPWATRAGVPSAPLTQAMDQIRSWKAWFSEPHNVLAFERLYDIGPEELRGRRLVQHYVLVFGRRDEATRIESFAKKRHHLQGPNEFLMTYDRLEPHPSDDLTVTLDRSGPDTKLRLVSVPPTYVLRERDAALASSLVGREEAIRGSTLISDARKEFLLERFRYADKYARQHRDL